MLRKGKKLRWIISHVAQVKDYLFGLIFTQSTFVRLILSTEDFLEHTSEIEVAPKKTPPPSYSETYSNYCLHEKI